MARKRGHESIDEVISKRVEDAIEERLEEKELEDEIRSPDENDPILKRILSSFPSSEGYYGKLYKVLPSGKEEMKYTFSALEEINDPEVEVSELAKQRGWGSGDYRLRVYRHGASGLARSLGMRIDVGDGFQPQQSSQPMIQNPPPSEILRETINTASALKNLIPSSEIPMKELSQTLSETFKAGIQVTKEALTPQVSGSQDIPIKIISMLKEMGLLDKREATSELEITERVIKNLKEMGVISQPKNEDDILNKLIKLREVGLIKLAGEDKEDAASLAEKIKPLIDLVNSLGLTGNPPERLNFWNTIAPHIPTFIEKLASPLKDYLELRKLEVEDRIRERIPVQAPQISVQQQKNSPQTAKVNQGNSLQMNPVIQEIMNAVEERNTSYFPKLKELIAVFIGPHINSALLSGQVTPDTIISLVMNSQYGQFFNKDHCRIYLEDFVNWLREQEASNILVARCNKCNQEFEFKENEWVLDSKICDCGGMLEKVS